MKLHAEISVERIILYVSIVASLTGADAINKGSTPQAINMSATELMTDDSIAKDFKDTSNIVGKNSRHELNIVQENE
jgi:hypothetical protein